MKTAEQWIHELELEPHPEGGYYRQTDLSKQSYSNRTCHLPLYTNIYFLLMENNPSHFHQLTSDELWFFHAGSPLTVHSISEDGVYRANVLGLDSEAGQQLHYTVPAKTIFGSSVEEGYALVSCTVVPGFDFADFKLFTKQELMKDYPQHENIIERLAYDTLPE